MADASKYEVVSRCLQAASGAVPGDLDDALYLIHVQSDGASHFLKESQMEGSTTVESDKISTGVKERSPVAYLYDNFDERFAFAVDEENTLRFYTYDGRWKESQLGSLPKQKLHPNSQLAACFTPTGIVVYFQDPSRKFSGVEEQGGVWKALTPLDVKTRDGTPLSVSFSEEESRLILNYIGEDKALHYLSVADSTGKFEDHTYPGTKFDKHVENFLVFRGDQSTEAYFITPSETRNSSVLHRVDGDGNSAVLGYSTDVLTITLRLHPTPPTLIMNSKFHLDAGDVGEGYDNLPDSLDSGRFTDKPDDRKFWVVKLEFVKGNPLLLIPSTTFPRTYHLAETEKQSWGTGFFFNVPESAYDVILTAGHNLIDSSGSPAKDLKVHTLVPKRTPNGIIPDVQITSIDDSSWVKVCPAYAANPVTNTNAINDWGAILLPKSRMRAGFGYNLRVGVQEMGKNIRVFDRFRGKVVDTTYKPHVEITSYRITDRVGAPLERSGDLFIEGEERLRDRQLEYGIDTEEGMSGSPVWTANRGGECVVAIHNQNQRSEGRGSRGTRLNESVLRQIFEWAAIPYASRAIKAYNSKAPRAGVYFHIRNPDTELSVIIDPTPQQVSKFDVIPAYAPPGASRTSQPLYALYHGDPAGSNCGQWVHWMQEKEVGELRPTFMNACMFQIRNKPTEKGFKIVFSRLATSEEKKNAGGVREVLVELRLDTSMISEDDLLRGDNVVEKFAIFEQYFKSTETEFNQFVLE
ncbi:hypothetical protein K505DRAFT_374011 [Melanomma pulvis-pyrius CBS 109.77]|uniref:Serine protease n=1 Tax=Melanomma pulvis-pyrius CBS 109.77 TaxID=1314802 RepID=A0A6A6XGX3_9PLEO|nr:hypothetical protein K505DRAFT_374011 [Melanomma pulvis-pyrius CBS 109.77]